MSSNISNNIKNYWHPSEFQGYKNKLIIASYFTVVAPIFMGILTGLAIASDWIGSLIGRVKKSEDLSPALSKNTDNVSQFAQRKLSGSQQAPKPIEGEVKEEDLLSSLDKSRLGEDELSRIQNLIKTAKNDEIFEIWDWIVEKNSDKDQKQKLINALIQFGHIDGQDPDGWSLLNKASYYGLVDVVDKLIDNKANLELKNKMGATALQAASHKGHTEVVKKLISAGASLKVVNESELTALHIAAQKGHTDVVRELITAKADLNATAQKGWTPLHVAAKYGHIDVVRELIKAKADLMLQVQERTALEIADHYKYHIKTKEEDRNKYFEIAKLLAEAQVQV